MSPVQTCKNCGKPLQPNQLFCECGAVVDVGGSGLPNLPDVNLPGLKIGVPKGPSMDFSIPQPGFGKLSGVETDISQLKIDFSAGKAAQGREYKPVLAIGKTGEAEGAVKMPFGIALLPDSSLYIIDLLDRQGRTRLQHFDSSGSLISLVRKFGPGDRRDELDTPAAIAAEPGGCVYILDMGTSSLKKLDAEGQVTAVMGEEGMEAGQLMQPRDLVIDSAGALYIADAGNNRLVKWSPQGQELMVLGLNQLDEENGWLMNGSEPGEFDDPQGVALDKEGNLYVADANNHRVQKFSPTGEFLLAFGEEGEGAGQLSYPCHVRLNAEGDIFVAETGKGRVQKFDPEGHFVYQVVLPGDAGAVHWLEIAKDGKILVALRDKELVLGLEVV